MGLIFTCGDAKRMAKDVDAALHEIVSEQGGMDMEAAQAYVSAMKKTNVIREMYTNHSNILNV